MSISVAVTAESVSLRMRFVRFSNRLCVPCMSGIVNTATCNQRRDSSSGTDTMDDPIMEAMFADLAGPSSSLPGGGNSPASRPSTTSTNGKHKPVAPPEYTSLFIRNLPPQWGKTEVASFVMDCLGGDAVPINLPASYMTEYLSHNSAAESTQGSSLAPTSFGAEETVTDAFGVSIDEERWYPIRKVSLLHSIKKGVSIRRAIVTFNPYPNLTGVVAPIRPNGEQSIGMSSSGLSGAAHPLVKIMLRVNPEDVTPGINDLNRRFQGQKLVTNTGLVEIDLFRDESDAPTKYPNDPTKWTEKDRVLWEANNVPKVLETLDIDRFMMSPDLLFDFQRMKQKKILTRAEVNNGGITINSFKAQGKSPRKSTGSAADPETKGDGIGDTIGRGSPLNVNGIMPPYIDKFR